MEEELIEFECFLAASLNPVQDLHRYLLEVARALRVLTQDYVVVLCYQCIKYRHLPL